MPADKPSPLLTVCDLNVGFQHPSGYQRALTNLNFDLYRHEVLALVGESGSGKSLTALSILGLLPADARIGGTVTFAGQSLLDASPRQLQQLRGKRIAMIFQDPRLALDPVFSIGEQIAEVLLTHKKARDRAAARARTLELLQLVEIPDAAGRIDAYPHQLSGGQCQRVMIAMALACDPDMLIADEPTTALDATIQKEILQMLRQLRRRIDIAILLITHDMGVVANIADRAIVLRRGEIVETADIADLFSRPRADYTRALLAAIPRYQRKPPAAAFADAPVRVNVEGLHVEYRRRGQRFRALDNVSLSLPAGCFTGLVGESGSGKSTLGRALAGLISPSAGDITIDNVSMARGKSEDIRRIRQAIGFVFQSPRSSLNPRYSIAQSIAEPLEVHTDASKAAVAAQVDSLLEQVGLGAQWRQRYPHQLSGGQCQRVAIARALALKPTLLIADEPTSALDVSVQAHILDLLQKLQREYQFSCLFISHDLVVVSQLCRDVAVLKDGRLMEYGSVDNVLHRPGHAYTARLVDSMLHPLTASRRP
ncbi:MULTISPECIES: dipeptide ABC transporter ATP-binding protein [Brenneria]|uniref:ABC-type dipeptide transporter n=1 Tax=Brenneria nigrifluens DSM 30175 = ATCC 13028 TaxID=1121120 RepID=A0A2U1UV41_9GAMM|nr:MULTISPECIES: ABC transporter ATP-binding protein [Brenneria]EHD20050.1 Nickel-transporting ATPase., Fe(3+)-transporting ATPase [Brenneria sp. EniD312]PWC25545.1 ABC transporter ATP-binding protein [Brenneria nigrifluens DSM 30175 = ATCC 13028]QCR03290.1 ABC transporter ATP-binding protein [Brenneria nigrifluens DSM 30175 = ATCC 13028]